MSSNRLLSVFLPRPCARQTHANFAGSHFFVTSGTLVVSLPVPSHLWAPCCAAFWSFGFVPTPSAEDDFK
jgi:hypothetical protein